MRKKLLSFALVLAMVAAMFAPTVSVLAEGAGEVQVVILNRDRTYSYGDDLYVDIEFRYADGSRADVGDEYSKAPCAATLSNSDGEVVWKSENEIVAGYYVWHRPISLTDPAMKAWASGMYTLRLEITVGGEILSDAFSFSYEGWNDAEPASVSLEVEPFFEIDGMYFDVTAAVTDADGKPVQVGIVLFRLFDPDGEEMFGSENITGSDGTTPFGFYLFDGENAFGTYTIEACIKDSAGKTVSACAPVEFREKNKPEAITLETPPKSEYGYGESIDLEIKVTDQDGNPAQFAVVTLKILNADGHSLDAGDIRELHTAYAQTDTDGIARSHMRIYDRSYLPEGDYLLRVSAGDAAEDFPFSVKAGDLQLALSVYNGDRSSRFSYGDRMNVWAQIAYADGWTDGIDEAFVKADLHWWIKNSEGEILFEQTVPFCETLDKYGWTLLDEDSVPGIKEWEAGEYTVVAEVTANSVTLHDETDFDYVGHNGAGESANLTVELDTTTVRFGEYILMTIAVTDEKGIPSQGQWVHVYLRYETGEPACVRNGQEVALADRYLGASGTDAFNLWFDAWDYYDEPVLSGAYVLVFACDGLTVEKTIVYMGKNGGEHNPGTGGDVLYGDIDGNGEINSVDYMLLKRYCLKTGKLNDQRLDVADIDGNGEINSVDYMLLKRCCLDTYTIKQGR